MADEVYEGAIGIDLGTFHCRLQNSDTFSKVKAPLTFLVDRHHILLRYVLEALRKQKNNRHM
jgi:hypothetical protein